ncbi:putative lipoprotein [Hyphomonas neptunium ATCC 15444]|uniref:Putative lipoprotein n=2 Tax=Hyphomonas TaxID=85 RepID=Q0BY58_HYPNA|nr:MULTISPECIES: hypothetical protein [Hyphomonas]ABI78401.1 putative lipoprotein [Hyphomonas neptunium ATCC 15444]KCZ88815.1 putative lipoprotein [Hyphomonas hirschiana VP5]
MMIRFALAAMALASLGACATQPEPCTTEWVQYRTDRILGQFASENRGLVNDLRRLTREDGKVDPVQSILLAAQAEDIQQFARSFETVVVPELNSAIQQCGRHENFVPAFTQFLRNEGVPETSLQWVGPILALVQVMQDDGQLQSGPRP